MMPLHEILLNRTALGQVLTSRIRPNVVSRLDPLILRTPEFSGVWVVEAPSNGAPPRVIVGQAGGEFVVQ